ncbi:MAG TPA: hypothetical protein VF883_05470 [Thermoanaerobaculia bacterium]|jgi:hypothetical protein
MNLHDALHNALISEDEAYLAAERTLFATPRDAARALERIAPADPAAATLGRVLHDAAERPLDGVDPFLDIQAANAVGTPVPVPVSETVASLLRYRFGAGLDPFLAWRLAKQPSLPLWRALSFVRYVAVDRDPDALPALARFVTLTGDDYLRGEVWTLLERQRGVAAALAAEARFQARRP